jgi:hypothetical protein
VTSDVEGNLTTYRRKVADSGQRLSREAVEKVVRIGPRTADKS